MATTIYVTAVVLCLAGIGLACVSFSGQWLVVIAALLALWLHPSHAPGWGVAISFIILSVLAEVAESLAGWWGVKRRGGATISGFMALVGGLAGMWVGTLVLPVIGSIVGMLAGSFALVYAVERIRLARDAAAVHVATGAVLARVAAILLKVLLTLVLSLWLLILLARS